MTTYHHGFLLQHLLVRMVPVMAPPLDKYPGTTSALLLEISSSCWLASTSHSPITLASCFVFLVFSSCHTAVAPCTTLDTLCFSPASFLFSWWRLPTSSLSASLSLWFGGAWGSRLSPAPRGEVRLTVCLSVAPPPFGGRANNHPESESWVPHLETDA